MAIAIWRLSLINNFWIIFARRRRSRLCGWNFSALEEVILRLQMQPLLLPPPPLLLLWKNACPALQFLQSCRLDERAKIFVVWNFSRKKLDDALIIWLLNVMDVESRFHWISDIRLRETIFASLKLDRYFITQCHCLLLWKALYLPT